MKISDLERLRRALANPPGEAAQYRMAPALRRERFTQFSNIANARQSGVLALLFPREGEIHTVLIRRGVYDGVHSGQVSFPGGKHEPEDPDLGFTALREMEEEIGVPGAGVDLLGALSQLYVPASHSNIHAFVGFLPSEPDFVPHTREVAGLLMVSLTELFDDAYKAEKEITVGSGVQLTAPYYGIQNEVIWGATAMILSELEALVKGLD